MNAPDAVLNQADFERFCALIRKESGLVIPDERRIELGTAVRKAMLETGAQSAADLHHALTQTERGRAALKMFVAALTIGETHFFRNEAQFAALQEHILPDIIERRRPERRIRVWSAGCASGEEPYSIAILLERLLPDIDQWDVHILGTDIAHHALEKARRGVYRAWSFREVPTEIETAYFTPRDGDRELSARIRDRVTLRYLNLIEDTYPALITDTVAMDLILCRNVLIYFDAPTVQRVVGRLHETLDERGWLLVGHSEPSQRIFHQFHSHNYPGAVAYQKLRPGAQERRSPARPAPRPRVRPAPPVAPPAQTPSADTAASAYDEALRLLADGAADQALGRAEAAAAHEQGPRAPLLAARICAGRMQVEDAERFIDEALARDPLNVPAQYLRGLLRADLGHLDEALVSLRRTVFLDPAFVLGHFALAGLFQRLGQVSRARKHLDTVGALLENVPRDQAVEEGEGLSAGRLAELAHAQRQLLDSSEPIQATP